MLTVFISSTLEDLGPYREKARDAVLRLGWQPLMCDYWAAGGNPPLATCLEKVEPREQVERASEYGHLICSADCWGLQRHVLGRL